MVQAPVSGSKLAPNPITVVSGSCAPGVAGGCTELALYCSRMKQDSESGSRNSKCGPMLDPRMKMPSSLKSARLAQYWFRRVEAGLASYGANQAGAPYTWAGRGERESRSRHKASSVLP